MTIAETVCRQLDATWRQWRVALEQLPSEAWATGAVDYLIPARHALHVPQTADAYLRDELPSNWNALLAERFGRQMDWEGTPAAELPDAAAVRAYLDDVSARTKAWILAHDDAAMLAPRTIFPWTGPNLLSRCICVIRHQHDHVGQWNAEMRRRDLPRAAWIA